MMQNPPHLLPESLQPPSIRDRYGTFNRRDQIVLPFDIAGSDAKSSVMDG